MLKRALMIISPLIALLLLVSHFLPHGGAETTVNDPFFRSEYNYAAYTALHIPYPDNLLAKDIPYIVIFLMPAVIIALAAIRKSPAIPGLLTGAAYIHYIRVIAPYGNAPGRTLALWAAMALIIVSVIASAIDLAERVRAVLKPSPQAEAAPKRLTRFEIAIVLLIQGIIVLVIIYGLKSPPKRGAMSLIEPPSGSGLTPFYMDKLETTQIEYYNVMGKYPSSQSGCEYDCPVDNVSYYDAMRYCALVGKRLPTGAEWDYAAKSGGPAPRDLSTGIHPVGISGPDGNGLFEMRDNVEEWIAEQTLRLDATRSAGPANPELGRPGSGFRCARSAAR